MPKEASRPDRPRPTDTPRRRPTLQDIADVAGVSPGLVSVVLRGLPGASTATAAKVLDVARRMGYRANRNASQLARRRTRLLGVMVFAGNPYHSELIEEIQAASDAGGFEVILAAVSRTNGERRSIEALVDSNCEALVLLGPTLPAKEIETAIDNVPTVCIGRPIDLPHVDVVRSADIEAMELLVDHLAALGHTRIAHIDGGDLPLPRERIRGFETAMRARRLEPLTVPGGETQDSGTRAAAELLNHPDVTAAVAYNDLCAIGIMDHLLRNEVRVPEDISVTGFDDDSLANHIGINLTTVNPSKFEQARLAVAAALERAAGTRTQRIIHAPAPHLMVRGSTAPPRTSRPQAKRSPLVEG